MKADLLIDAIGDAREEYVLDAETTLPKKKPAWLKLTAAAACLALLAGAASLSGLLRGPGDYMLSERSENVRVYRLKDPHKNVPASHDLMKLTDEDIFSANTVIFRGTVTDIENIEVDMNGESFYWSIVSVEVSKVLRGELTVGQTVRIRADTPIGGGVWVEDNDIVSQIRVGMEGIFMPAPYDADSLFGANGAWLCLRDIAPYGFRDGVRWVFLRTETGLVFARGATYSIPDAHTLEDIEAYILDMLEKTATHP